MNKRYIFSLLAVVVMFGILVYLQIKPPAQASKNIWIPEKQRAYADKLKSEGLNKEAINAYQEYIRSGSVEPGVQANIYYIMGKLAEKSGEYETALAFLYKAQIVDPETKLKSELGGHIVRCLENMGRGLDAENKLAVSTRLQPAGKAKGKVLAKIGNEVITDQMLNQEIEKLPKWMRKNYQKPDKRIQFLKEYIATELFARKARRLGYGKLPEIRQKMADIKKQLIVKKLIDEQMQKKLQITPYQLQLYYKANKDKYIEPAKIKISYITANTEDAVNKLAEQPGVKFKKVDEWIEKGQGYIQGIGNAKKLAVLCFKADIGKIAGPVKLDKKFYMAKLMDKQPKRQLSFDEVKDKVSYEYKMEQQKVIYKELLENELKAEKVEIYAKD